MAVTVLGKTFNTLAAAHAWLHRENPPGKEIVVLGAGDHFEPSILWTWSRPDTRVVIRGGSWNGHGTEEPWLTYRPVAADSSITEPTKARFWVDSVMVSGYQRAGLVVSPDDGTGGKWTGGNTAWCSGITVTKSIFGKIGSVTPYKWSDNKFGVAGVLLHGVVGSTIRECTFTDLVNSPKSVTDKPNAAALIHGVYVRDRCRGVNIDKCTFTRISGDPVRVTSSSARVAYCKATMAGERAMVSEWKRPDEEAAMIVLDGNKPGTLFNGKSSPVLWRA